MNDRGFTLIEALTVVTIISILAVALAYTYSGWMGKYRVESTIKTIHADLLDARQRALMRDREYFADFNQPPPPANKGSYRIIEDSNNNGVLYSPAAPTIEVGNNVLRSFPKVVDYPITWAAGSISFDEKGIIQPSVTPLGATLCIFTDFDGDGTSDFDPDYDCIVISPMRLQLGKLTLQNTAGGTCSAANCVTK
ncbi:hypothetical protein BMS3Abin07_01979 [bacterium BMS3Abin07]|nr:hypothetical protein BMS3Abin07_01979 [bacterium BMS3Abin07]GBE32424.1 hypothetical protein BMS3Bbin05_01339 [bacterium BMS3Bbin05]HDO23363.1 prepilin-type N-terminal cleavage/methylation domain-containing protein [Nitrospirota bacterium]